jgi:hypothetical protein
VVIWYIFTHFGILCQEKSGNPDWSHTSRVSLWVKKNKWVKQLFHYHFIFANFFAEDRITQWVYPKVGRRASSFRLMEDCLQSFAQ